MFNKNMRKSLKRSLITGRVLLTLNNLICSNAQSFEQPYAPQNTLAIAENVDKNKEGMWFYIMAGGACVGVYIVLSQKKDSDE